MTDAPHTPLTQPESRTWIQWTPDLLRAAELQGSTGALWLAAHLCYSLQADDRVRGCLLQLGAVPGLPLTWSADRVDGRRSNRLQKLLEPTGEGDLAVMAPPEQLAQLVASGALLGYGLAQLRWEYDPLRRRMLPRMEAWDTRLTRWDPTRQDLVVVTTEGERSLTEDNAGPYPRWLLYTPWGANRPWQRGAWRAVARWWLLKQYAQSDWARLSEKAGGLWSVFTDDPEHAAGSDTDRTLLAQQLAAMGRDAAVAQPAGWKAELLSLSNRAHQTFVEQVANANIGIAVALLGQNLTTEVQGGSYSAAQVHERVAGVVIRQLAQPLAGALSRLVEAWARWNFSTAGPEPEYQTDPPADTETAATAQKAAADAVTAWKSLGVDVDVVAAAQAAGVPLASTKLAEPEPPEPLAIEKAEGEQGADSKDADERAEEEPEDARGTA